MAAEQHHNDRCSLRLLTCARMARADQAAMAFGVPGLELMENAGRAVAEVATDMTPGLGRVAVLCGPGNNGGDGFVAARYLAARGRRVTLGLLGDRDKLSGDAGEMARRYTGKIEAVSADVLAGADLVVDALFGAGLSRPIERDGVIAGVFSEIVSRGIAVLAVDVPSGLDGDCGVAGGAVLPADRTVTFFRLKPGHLLLPGRDLCGALTVADIGIPAAVLEPPYQDDDAALAFANGVGLWRHALPQPARSGHKYSRGHAVIVSGGIAMSGAARLAARAAQRIGAGLVTVAAPPAAIAAHAAQLNAILLSEGQEPEDLRQLLSDERKNAVVIGPGLGVGGRGSERVTTVLA
ncbi:MAG: NAD(P)H-hydrate epimerase, partial [Alphaproteobacteria bacterium]|nr:NAD(P)H-hydrate epimerase [Alphaproteobacteria bacterium]